MRIDEEHILRKVLRMDIPGNRKRGRPKTRRTVPTRLEQDWDESELGGGQNELFKWVDVSSRW